MFTSARNSSALAFKKAIKKSLDRGRNIWGGDVRLADLNSQGKCNHKRGQQGCVKENLDGESRGSVSGQMTTGRWWVEEDSKRNT